MRKKLFLTFLRLNILDVYYTIRKKNIIFASKLKN